MDVLLVEPRGEPASGRRSFVSLAAAKQLRALGEVERVRCLIPASTAAEATELESVATPDGVELLAVVSPWPAFHQVMGRLDDPVSEAELARWLRDDLPDVVHTFGVGVGGSCLTGWVADRLGAPAISATDAAAVLCARGSLIDSTGSACSDWSDPARCAECCRHAVDEGDRRGRGVRDHGLSPREAQRSRRWAWLGRWSRFPVARHFAIRTEAILGGLVWSRRIVVPSEHDRQLLLDAQLPRDRVVVREDRPEAWVALYRELLSSVVSS